MTEALPASPAQNASPLAPASIRAGAWIAAAVALVWFVTLAMRHLLPSDEGRYAEIAREMFASGDWVTIRYNGLKYFEKPPFHLWMTALAFHAFGVGDWQARLWVALSGVVGLGMTMLAADRWFGRRAAWLTGLVLLAAPAWNAGGHFNSLDMGVSAALACVLASVLMAQHPRACETSQRRWMWAAWAAMAVAILTKGLIGLVLPGLVLVVYTLIARDWVLWKRLHIVTGTLLMLAIAAPWFVLVSMRNPEFAHFFFIHEHWERYTSSVHGRSAPMWYFLPQMLVDFLPWIGLAWAMGAVVRGEAKGPGFRPILLLTVWAVAIFVFFSLSNSKLPGYILPIFPALAILAALALERLDARAWQRQIVFMIAVMALGLLAATLFGRFDWGGTPKALYLAFRPWLAGTCALALAGLLAALALGRKGRPWPSRVVFCLAMFGFTTVGMLGHETFGRGSSGVDLAAPMQALLTPGMPIYSVRRLDHDRRAAQVKRQRV